MSATPVALVSRTRRATRGAPLHLWWRVLRFWVFRWRRTWRASVAGNFVYPVVYLAAMGVGLGGLVNHHLAHGGTGAIGGLSYLVYVTPGILAGSMMSIGVQEASYPVMGALRWDRAYFTQLASPITVRAIVAGHLAFLALRAAVAATVFVAIAAGFGALESPESVVAVPVSILVAVSFGAPLAAFSVTRENDSAFSTVQRLVIVPLFLFSGSFFPVALLPAWLRLVAVATPLYHGVMLTRACTTGRLNVAGIAVHGAYLCALAAIGMVVAGRTYRRRLTP